jgi:hypothetical protein
MKLIESNISKYSSQQVLLTQRFRAFQNILNPCMLTFDKFEEKYGIIEDYEHVINEAIECFSISRKYFDIFRQHQSDAGIKVEINLSDLLCKKKSTEFFKVTVFNKFILVIYLQI